MTDRAAVEGDTRPGRVVDRNGKTVREYVVKLTRLKGGKLAWVPTTLVRVRIYDGERVEVYR